MKVVILAGGYGTRISEESQLKPKPMVTVGDMPIIWHIMKIFSHYGFDDFIICCGYKGYVIKEYFANYFLHSSDVTFDFKNNNNMIVHNNVSEPWRVTLVDTGTNTMTGGRVKRIQDYIPRGEQFFLTYGDGVADICIDNLLRFHNNQHSFVTMTAVQPNGRFGAVNISEDMKVNDFCEKPMGDGGWINGGFFVMNYEFFNYVLGDDIVLEKEPLEDLCKEGKLSAYKHEGFWQPMDTMRDHDLLEKLWLGKEAPWKVW